MERLNIEICSLFTGFFYDKRKVHSPNWRLGRQEDWPLPRSANLFQHFRNTVSPTVIFPSAGRPSIVLIEPSETAGRGHFPNGQRPGKNLCGTCSKNYDFQREIRFNKFFDDELTTYLLLLLSIISTHRGVKTEGN